MKQNLQEYSIVHEKTFIYNDGTLEFLYICEDPGNNEFATISGFYNLEKKEDDHGIILGYTGSNFFQTKQDALEESQNWMEQFIQLEYDPLASIVSINMEVEKNRSKVK